ncbi:MAG: T9SS type A sorting domain-containing protein [Flavobacteriales bacterium]|nr:T9SS type A sorting domain-containing protein [Flavobacteriales bacterium]
MLHRIAPAALSALLLAHAPHLSAQGGGAPVNDVCTGATVVALSPGVPAVRNGDSSGSTDEVGFGAAQVWEAFSLSQCMDVTVDLCGTTPAFPNSFINLVIGCPITNIVNTGVFEFVTCGDGNVTIVFPNLPQGTYYFPVINEPGSSGPYTLTFTGQTCTTPPPANDECSGAITLVPDAGCTPVNGTTLGATGSLPAIACGGFTGDANDDVWFSFEATTTEHSVVVEPSLGFNAVIDVLEGSCGATTNIACSDQGALGATETVLLSNLTVGNTYFVRVYDWYGGQPSGPTFTICVQGGGTAPANDLCATVTADPLASGGTITFTGNNTGATTLADAATTSLLNDGVPKVWHAFTLGDCANVTITYCGSTPAFDEIYPALTTSCPADQALFTSQADFTCTDTNAEMVFVGLAPGTYYIPVGSFGTGSTGDYVLTVSADDCPVPPANDECATAAYIPVLPLQDCPGNSTDGYTTSATVSFDDPTCVASQNGYQDVWYIFEPGINTQVQITLENLSMSNAALAVYEGCGGAEVACVLSPTGAVTVNTTPNQPHYVRVMTNTDFGSGGDFLLCIGADITTSVDARVVEDPIAVFPDPAQDHVDVRWSGAPGAVLLSLTDLMGRVMLSGQRNLATGEVSRVDLAGVAPGGYVLRCETAHGSWQRRITVR